VGQVFQPVISELPQKDIGKERQVGKPVPGVSTNLAAEQHLGRVIGQKKQ
jgi:hypothetical protein